MGDDQFPMSDHDRLIRIDERVEKLDRCMTNHLKQHWLLTITALSAAAAGLMALIVAFLRGVG